MCQMLSLYYHSGLDDQQGIILPVTWRNMLRQVGEFAVDTLESMYGVRDDSFEDRRNGRLDFGRSLYRLLNYFCEQLFIGSQSNIVAGVLPGGVVRTLPHSWHPNEHVVLEPEMVPLGGMELLLGYSGFTNLLMALGDGSNDFNADGSIRMIPRLQNFM